MALVQSPCVQLGLLFFPSSPPKMQNSLRAVSVLDSNDGQAAGHIGAENFRQVLAPTSREGRWPRVSMLSLHSPHMREKAYSPSLSPLLLPLVVITHTHTHTHHSSPGTTTTPPEPGEGFALWDSTAGPQDERNILLSSGCWLSASSSTQNQFSNWLASVSRVLSTQR